MTTSEIAGTGAALEAGAPIEANDGSIARILGKRPVLWVGAGPSIAAGYPMTGALIDALVAAADDPIDRTRSFYEVVDAVVVSVRAGRVRDVLQRLFQPTPLHPALARLAKAGTFAARCAKHGRRAARCARGPKAPRTSCTRWAGPSSRNGPCASRPAVWHRGPPSSEGDDDGDKRRDFQSLASLEAYVIAAQGARCVKAYRRTERGEWRDAPDV